MCSGLSTNFFKMNIKEGQSIDRPLLLKGPNYGYLKTRMKAFLKAWNVDENAWNVVESGRTAPTIIDQSEAVGNSKAMNAIFFCC